MNQNEVFAILESKILGIQKTKHSPICVAINGIEGTGKTTCAKHLVSYLSENDHTAFHVSIDGFHFHRAHRYMQGRDSARGYYEDSYNEYAFVEKVLKLSQQADPSYISAIHDLDSDAYLDLKPVRIPANSILIVDGAYLFKSTYYPHWDLKIYLKTDFATALDRGVKRDGAQLGGVQAAKQKYADRYHAASKIYINDVHPEKCADIVIDNTDFNNLLISKLLN